VINENVQCWKAFFVAMNSRIMKKYHESSRNRSQAYIKVENQGVKQAKEGYWLCKYQFSW